MLCMYAKKPEVSAEAARRVIAMMDSEVIKASALTDLEFAPRNFREATGMQAEWENSQTESSNRSDQFECRQ